MQRASGQTASGHAAIGAALIVQDVRNELRGFMYELEQMGKRTHEDMLQEVVNELNQLGKRVQEDVRKELSIFLGVTTCIENATNPADQATPVMDLTEEIPGQLPHTAERSAADTAAQPSPDISAAQKPSRAPAPLQVGNKEPSGPTPEPSFTAVLPAESCGAVEDVTVLPPHVPGPCGKAQENHVHRSGASGGAQEEHAWLEQADRRGSPTVEDEKTSQTDSLDDVNPRPRASVFQKLGRTVTTTLQAISPAQLQQKMKTEDKVRIMAATISAPRSFRESMKANPQIRDSGREGARARFLAMPAVFVLCVKSGYFDYIMGVLLMMNALQIGVQTDYMAHSTDKKVPSHFRILQTSFCVVFTFELLARIAVYRSKFFYIKEWMWNVFDTVVVSFQVIDEATVLIMEGSDVQKTLEGMDLLRILRLVRVLRLVRMVRLIPELKSMVYLIIASLSSFVWTAVLLLLMMYSLGIYFTEVASGIIHDHRNDPKHKDQLEEMKNVWGSLSSSILSLYMAITGGDDWANLVNVYKDYSYLPNICVFTTYIGFATLVMLNLVTGVFVEGAQRIIKEDKEAAFMQQVCRLFMAHDEDNSKDICYNEFVKYLELPELEQYFRLVDLTKKEAKDLFRVLDTDKSGSISVEEFIRGCLKLRGPARSADLAVLLDHQNAMEDIMRDLDVLVREIRNLSGDGVCSVAKRTDFYDLKPHYSLLQ